MFNKQLQSPSNYIHVNLQHKNENTEWQNRTKIPKLTIKRQPDKILWSDKEGDGSVLELSFEMETSR